MHSDAIHRRRRFIHGARRPHWSNPPWGRSAGDGVVHGGAHASMDEDTPSADEDVHPWMRFIHRWCATQHVTSTLKLLGRFVQATSKAANSDVIVRRT